MGSRGLAAGLARRRVPDLLTDKIYPLGVEEIGDGEFIEHFLNAQAQQLPDQPTLAELAAHAGVRVFHAESKICGPGNRGEHFTDGDPVGWPAEKITALAAAHSPEQRMTLQGDGQLFQKLFRYPGQPRYLRQVDRIGFPPMAGDFEHESYRPSSPGCQTRE